MALITTCGLLATQNSVWAVRQRSELVSFRAALGLPEEEEAKEKGDIASRKPRQRSRRNGGGKPKRSAFKGSRRAGSKGSPDREEAAGSETSGDEGGAASAHYALRHMAKVTNNMLQRGAAMMGVSSPD